jgi:hypothetical protein
MTPKECQRALELALRARWLGKFNNLSARQIDRLCARVIARRFPEFSKFQIEHIIEAATHWTGHHWTGHPFPVALAGDRQRVLASGGAPT